MNSMVMVGMVLVLVGVTIVSRPAGLVLVAILVIVGSICLTSAASGTPEEREP